MNKGILFAAIIVLTTGTVLCAEDGKLGATFDFSYHSRWLSKGALGYGQQGAFFSTVDLDFYGTGFGTKVTHRNAMSSGYVDKQRFDYRPYYKGQLFDDKSYLMKYNISSGYEHYYGLDRRNANTTWEWIFAFSWPKLFKNGIVPSYICHYEYPAGHDWTYNLKGFVHRFRLSYLLNNPSLPKPINLIGEVAYTDQLGGATSDWSYAMFGANTKLKINKNADFVPGIYHQITMDKSVNTNKSLTYCILSMIIRTN